MILEEILNKGVEELNEEEKKYLREHKEDLTAQTKETYKSVLEEETGEGEKKESEDKKEEGKKDEGEDEGKKEGRYISQVP